MDIVNNIDNANNNNVGNIIIILNIWKGGSETACKSDRMLSQKQTSSGSTYTWHQLIMWPKAAQIYILQQRTQRIQFQKQLFLVANFPYGNFTTGLLAKCNLRICEQLLSALENVNILWCPTRELMGWNRLGLKWVGYIGWELEGGEGGIENLAVQSLHALSLNPIGCRAENLMYPVWGN